LQQLVLRCILKITAKGELSQKEKDLTTYQMTNRQKTLIDSMKEEIEKISKRQHDELDRIGEKHDVIDNIKRQHLEVLEKLQEKYTPKQFEERLLKFIFAAGMGAFNILHQIADEDGLLDKIEEEKANK
jgi:hypothetical protein